MSRILLFVCMACMLVCHTSCSDDAVDLEAQTAIQASSASDQRVQNLILRAREGDVEACKSLIYCYRDGDGVEKSFLNMLLMSMIYTQKTGGDTKDIVSYFKDNEAFKLICEILNTTSFNDSSEGKLQRLKQLAPVEAKAIEAAVKAVSDDEIAASMHTIREAEEEGSEFAPLLQLMYYEKLNDEKLFEECLIRVSEKFPFYYQLLGDLYAKEYYESEDFSYIAKAVDCYYKADAHAFLLLNFADKLLGLYEKFGKKALPEADAQEIARLKRIAGSI